MRRCCVALQRLNSARPAVGMLLTFLKPMPRQHKRPLSLTCRPTHLPPSAPTADNLIHVFGPRSGCFILFLTVGPRGRARLGRHTKFVGQKPTGTLSSRIGHTTLCTQDLSSPSLHSAPPSLSRTSSLSNYSIIAQSIDSALESIDLVAENIDPAVH